MRLACVSASLGVCMLLLVMPIWANGDEAVGSLRAPISVESLRQNHSLLDIRLPSGTWVTAERDDFERRGRGNFTWRGKVRGTGLDAIPARDELADIAQAYRFDPISAERAERESRIYYAYEVDGCCPCDDSVCKLP